jgi:hypothetical protein
MNVASEPVRRGNRGDFEAAAGDGAPIPRLATVRAGDRATEFKQRCRG